MSAHTPGPWTTHKSKFTFAVSSETEPHAGLVAHIYAKGEPSADEVGFSRPEEDEANARLIAAAPELLEALRDFVWALEGMPGSVHSNIMDRAEAAIAKAEGSQP